MFVGRVEREAKEYQKRPPGTPAVTGTVSSRAVNRVHVMAEIQGRPIRCLLGCDRSVIERRCVSSAKLNLSTYELFTANKAPLRVIGDMDSIHGLTLDEGIYCSITTPPPRTTRGYGDILLVSYRLLTNTLSKCCNMT